MPLLFDFENVTVVRGDRPILNGFSLQVRAGEHLALIGPNGSGKSTLVKLMTGELYAAAGIAGSRIRLFGQAHWSMEEMRRRIGIVALDQLQHLSHEVLARQVTSHEMVLSGFFNSLGLWPHHHPTAAHRRRARQVLRFMGVAHLADRTLSAMSSGEQRRVLIGRALVHDPDVLILDEPTNSLDPGAVREFRALLRQLARRGRSIVLVTHQVADLVPEIERVLLLQNGRVLADGPTATTLTSARLSRLFGARLRLVRGRAHYDLLNG